MTIAGNSRLSRCVDGMDIMDGADPVDRLYGFVGLGPADRRFISRMHFRVPKALYYCPLGTLLIGLRATMNRMLSPMRVSRLSGICYRLFCNSHLISLYSLPYKEIHIIILYQVLGLCKSQGLPCAGPICSRSLEHVLTV